MKDYQYVDRKEWGPVRDQLFALIHKVQNEVRKYFTFQYEVIGSASRNMITREVDGNKGYDFDINLYVNDDDENYSPKEIKTILRNGFDKFSAKFSYDYAEDSKRVLTIKVKDKLRSNIIHSCDFAVVHDYQDNKGNWRQEHIHYNKDNNTYTWNEQPFDFYDIPEKAYFLKNNGHWQEVRKTYLSKKSSNTDSNKKSRSIYKETINEIYRKYQMLF